jgi:hypothetical protein
MVREELGAELGEQLVPLANVKTNAVVGLLEYVPHAGPQSHAHD